MTGFARKHMQRHGWSEGKGLGRTESGMKSAIKVKLKNNTMGLGHDQGAEFTFHWWDHIFNKAASSFKVNESEDGALIEKCEGKKVTPLLISNKRGLPTRLANKSLLYGTFVKSGTYDSSKTNDVQEEGVIEDFSSDDDSSDEDDSGEGGDKNGLINDTLQKMYLKTGLTGHKAARHGHSLNGKLQRLMDQEEQEQKLLPQSKTNESEGAEAEDLEGENRNDAGLSRDQSIVVTENSRTKKKKKEKSNSLAGNCPVTPTIPSGCDEIVVEEKKKKKKKKRIKEDNAPSEETTALQTSLETANCCVTETADLTSKLGKSRKHKLDDEAAVCLLQDQPKKKKKKKKEKGSTEKD